MRTKLPRDGVQTRFASTGDKESDRQLAAILCDPQMYVQAVLGHHPWVTHAEILKAVAAHPRVAVKACHASSKTFAAAELALWWITRYSDGIVITTAPKFEQVEKLLWMELHKALRGSAFKYPKPNLTELKLAPGNYAVGWSTSEGINFQGIHGAHVLIEIDEAPGIEAEIWEAIEGARAGGDVHILALGNPIIAGGPFYDAFTENRSGWKTITIDAFATPNLEGFTLESLRGLPPDLPADHSLFAFQPRPYLVSRRWVYERFWEWGEESPLWQARVRGQFPEQAEDALISLAWLEAAKGEPQDSYGRVIAGIDVAGPGDDETVVTIRSQDSILAQRFLSSPDPRGEVVAFLNPWKPRLEKVKVDSVGIGYNFGLHLRDLGFPVELVNVGTTANNPQRFANRKAEYFWGIRERFRKGEIRGLRDERTLSQLATIRYRANPRGQATIESKDELRRRGVKSPDRADSLVLAFAQDEDPVFENLMQQARALIKYEHTRQRGELSPQPQSLSPNPNPLIKLYNRTRDEARALRMTEV